MVQLLLGILVLLIVVLLVWMYGYGYPAEYLSNRVARCMSF